MEIFDIITIAWIGLVGLAGIITTLISTSKSCEEWSVQKIWTVSFSLAAGLVTCLILLISL